ncbi:MAG: elongation factor G [Christensenellaceae bacterium]|jgi:elongation factor G|nr:elongation factor G [Christensenellaceae bacterium]
MTVYRQDKIRNVALIGHSGEGKTSLLEALLFKTKSLDRLGKVDDGTSVSDYDQEEVARKISISLTCAYTTVGEYKINFLDVPGFFDFEGELIAALTVADAAIVVTTATGTISVGAEKALDYCISEKIPVAIFVNGINKENSDYKKTIESFKERYSNKIVPIELPILNGFKSVGFVNILEGKAYSSLGANEIAIPASLENDVKLYTESLAEIAAEASEELMDKFFGGDALTPDEIITGVATRFAAAEIIPITAGVAVNPIEPGDLIKYIIGIFPDPSKGRGLKYDNGTKTLKCGDGKFAAQVFKSTVDPFVGKLLLFKVIRGKLTAGELIYNSNREENEKAISLTIVRGKKQDNVEAIYAGDIGALAKLSYTSNGDTLCDPTARIIFDPIKFPQPSICLSVVAVEKGSEEKVIAGLAKLMDEDSSYKLEKNIETNEMLLCGQGETQLDVLCKKLKNKFKVTATLNPPRIAYRETIKKTVEQQGKHKKQSGGHGQYGDVHIRFEPYYDGEFEFQDEIVGGVVPKQYIPAVEKGLRESIVHGVLAGYPVHGLKATLFFGSYHDVDSNELSFKMATGIAYRDGLVKANPVLLEPIMTIKVSVPDAYMGDIMGDLSKRRGRILGTESLEGKTIVTGEAPQSELTKYATDLRSMTQGRGKFTTTFSRYEEVPALLSAKIIEANKQNKDI